MLGSAFRTHFTRRHLIATSVAIAGAGVLGAVIARAAEPRLKHNASWIVYYGMTADPAALASYDVIVLDPNFSDPIAPLSARGAIVLSYLSVGEVSSTGPYFSKLKPKALLQEDPNWPGSFAVDLRNRSWRNLLIDKVIPGLLKRGFSGLFLDTLDSAAHLEQVDAVRYRGMRSAAIDVVGAIRRAFPSIAIIMNRGYALLPDVCDKIDAVAAESLITTYNFKTRSAQFTEADELARHLGLLRPAHDCPQPIPIFSLDYWDPQDPASARKIYERERALGHSPYVGTILLDQVVPEPST
jgi:uncharacterized protein (TIGR01370 family)